MWIQSISCDTFFRVMATSAHDAERVARLNERWTPRQICQLVSHEDARIRCLAAQALALVGDRRVSDAVARLLKEDHQAIYETAENALWAIWFRAGNDRAQECFRKGLAAMEAQNPADAAAWFFRAQRAAPDFAEAYHQAAIAYDMLDQWDRVMLNCWHAIGLVPCHFGAWSTLGHCYTHLEEMGEAAECYKQALRIHPHLGDIAFALGRLQQSFDAKTLA